MKDLVPETFAREWIAAWNRSDVEAVLTHYADEAVFVSPLAATVASNPEVHGKDALRAYWTKALHSLKSPPSFAFESLVWDKGTRALLIVYVSTEPARTVRKCELMYFNSNRLIDRGESFVGAALG